jgi:uncharacterized cofD-like protein
MIRSTPKKKTAVRLVTIGGGSGQSHLLWHLKRYPIDLTAVVSMVDNGGSTGVLRRRLGVLPPGDIRRCLVALAENQAAVQEIFEYRFSDGDLAGHTVGNLILASLALRHGSFLRAVQILSRRLRIRGRVLPVSVQAAELYARLANGQVIKGETSIDIPKHNPHVAIEQLYLRPKISALPQTLQALRRANVIVLTIGDLYTSVLPNLLVRGVTEAIAHSRARVIYTCNRTTKLGETHGFDTLDYVTTIERYLQCPLAGIVVDRSIKTDRTTKHLARYNVAALRRHGLTVSEANLRAAADPTSIDGKKLAAAIYRLCQQF